MTILRNTREAKEVWVECGEVVANAAKPLNWALLLLPSQALNWAGILMHFNAHSPPPTPFQPFPTILVISPIPAKKLQLPNGFSTLCSL